MAHARADNRYTRGLAEFVSGLRYERIPDEVRERIKLLMLDSLGCALFGADLEWSRILRGTLAAVDTTQGATVWGTAERLSAPHAALVNGTQVQGFELDDVHRQGVLHVGAVDAAGAVRDRRDCGRQLSGRDFLAAAVAGYEIGPRVGMCMGQEHIGQGWHSGATVGVFSAAAGAARGLRLDAGADGARARHRRHAGGRADGGAVRRHGQAHARRPLVAERALRRAACASRASPASSTCSRASTAASAPRSRARTTASISTS